MPQTKQIIAHKHTFFVNLFVVEVSNCPTNFALYLLYLLNNNITPCKRVNNIHVSLQYPSRAYISYTDTLSIMQYSFVLKLTNPRLHSFLLANPNKIYFPRTHKYKMARKHKNQKPYFRLPPPHRARCPRTGGTSTRNPKPQDKYLYTPNNRLTYNVIKTNILIIQLK